MKLNQRLGGKSADALVLQALSRGPLTAAQIDARIGLSKQGSRGALQVLIAMGKVVAEPFEGSPTRKQYRAVRP